MLLLAFGVMSGEAVAGPFTTPDAKPEPPHTPGRRSEIGGMAKCTPDAFRRAGAESRAAAVMVRQRYAVLLTDGIPSHKPVADTAAGFAALADAARELDLTVQVVGVPRANRDNLVAMSHGTEPLLLSEIDIPALFAWLRDVIVAVSVPRPRPADEPASPAGPPKG